MNLPGVASALPAEREPGPLDLANDLPSLERSKSDRQ
jgi:hypothetical protein